MKKLLVFAGVSLVLASCNVNYGGYPVRTSYPAGNSGSAANTAREYNELMKTYKPETAEVLNDLLNSDDPGNPRTSISVENRSPCNMVLTVSGNGFFKKIPIGAGKIGYTMVTKNQNYRLSGMLCNSSYQSTKFITTSYSIKLSN
ncbi:DUF6759 domain-containing protein [Chryseobacterium arthrosphaerae]|uniref:Competence protein ComL n=1 Tax=Chryseobacterium arthrosphaerae TaxID=651561 RepID=A0A1B8ZW50_9FLAO|nr:DUF6759 domain-containing protein [Chryseobacterium arthrosphaerae]AYZ15117.1 competence protein ComL [Chryseobacterium arthrosphaerae]MDG4652653.1 competence protein ComL [Chryseobacterium arthrosphaerae]OCA75814.1 competence protein ComL [Chryseobacterium arthrosphaerae]QUY54825.1 competence protein ComL [Chryseobacterium arthrosphaerae]RTZ50077.1 competence protein ComL [Chryseobacterium arthrosphaerae]